MQTHILFGFNFIIIDPYTELNLIVLNHPHSIKQSKN